MRRTGIVAAVGVVVAGCVLSVYPIVPESQATFEPRLLGTWTEVDGEDQIVVARGGPKLYSIEYVEAGGISGRFEARSGTLGQHTVLDAWPVAPQLDRPAIYEASLISGHALFVLELTEDQVRLAALDVERFRTALDAGELRLPHLRRDGDVILTGATDRTRAVLGEYLGRPEVLEEPTLWRRAEGVPR